MIRIHFIFSFLVGLSLLACQTEKKKLPIYGNREAEEKVVDGKTIVDTIYHTIPNYEFLNQDSVIITNKVFENRIYISNFFFTHCPTICPTMQRNLLKFYEKYKGDPRIAFLSHSIDFKYDSPSVLKSYANKLGVDSEQWQFVTGDKASIYKMADNYFVYAKEDKNVPGGYDHQGYLVLVDHDKRIRAAYDGTDDEQVQLLFNDVETLLKEYE
ncbi:SCO family protein [Sphingobacterium hungaricum]